MGIEFNKIGSLFNISNNNKVTSKREIGETNKISKKDEVKISREAMDYQLVSKAVKTIKELPHVREDKVEALRARIEAGNYNVEGREIAESLLNRGIDKRG